MADKGDSKIQKPGEMIKPRMSKTDAEELSKRVYGLEDGIISELNSYDDLNYYIRSLKTNRNSNIESIWPHGYVLKVMNSRDSKNTPLIDAQTEILLFLDKRKISAPKPVKNLKGEYYSLQRLPVNGKAEDQKEHMVRLLEFLPGKVLKEVPGNYTLYYQAGKFIAQVDEVLKDFHHPAYENHAFLWQLENGPQLKSFIFAVKDPDKKQLVKEVIKSFEEKVLTNVHNFERGIIHGDFNEHNILVTQNENCEWEIAAILDFGDVTTSYYFFELAISICYMLFECGRNNLEPLAGAGHVIAGYKKVKKSMELDYSLLKICICVRFCQSLVMGLYTHQILQPGNPYVIQNQDVGWRLLNELWSTPVQKLTEIWDQVIQSYRD